MIPTSTNVSVQLAKSAPSGAEAVAVFVHKGTKPGVPYPGLGEAERAMLDRLLSAGAVRGKSNELTIQLLGSGGANGKPRRLLVIGLGDRERFSAQCLREAGAALAKAARRHR